VKLNAKEFKYEVDLARKFHQWWWNFPTTSLGFWAMTACRAHFRVSALLWNGLVSPGLVYA